MIKINLIPFRAARRKENIRRQISVFLLSLLFISVVLVYYNTTLGSKISELESNIASTKKQLTATQKKARQVDQIKKKLNLLQRKTRVIRNLELNRKEPVKMLDAMTQLVVPERMWITSLKNQGRRINLNGIALDNQTVADFMTRMERSKLFSSISLKKVNQKRIGKNNLKSFAITANKRVAKAKKPRKKASKKPKKQKK
ncbi:MAG: PilN domain-containing protein [Desulfobacterales bacterium]|nr:PilN domain-containing protein [Desulfobacterales bacterium]